MLIEMSKKNVKKMLKLTIFEILTIFGYKKYWKFKSQVIF